MRDLFFVAFMSFAAIAGGYFLYTHGPESFTLFGQNSTTSFTVLYEGDRATEIVEPANYRITNMTDLVQLWPLIYGAEGPGVPLVDFSKYEVLALFDGTHSTGGFKISVDSLSNENGTRTVHLIHTIPGESCPVSSEISSPFQIVQIKKSDAAFAHTDRQVTATCS